MRFPLVALSLVMTWSVRADLRVVGSDLLGGEFSLAVYKYGGLEGLTLALALDGSRPGLDQLEIGRADLALVALPLEESPTIAGAASLTLAYHALIVVTPSDLPVERITLAELGSLFAGGDRGGAGRRSDRSQAAWASEGMMAAVPAAPEGMMVDFFRQTVLPGRTFSAAVIRYAGEPELVRLLKEDRRTIALASACPKGIPAVKTVAVAVGAGEPAFTPTPENLFAGDYPLQVPLRAVFRRVSAARLRPLLNFLLSDEVAQVLERAGLVPLAPAARRRQRLAVENL